jgi:hypothetical protein
LYQEKYKNNWKIAFESMESSLKGFRVTDSLIKTSSDESRKEYLRNVGSNNLKNQFRQNSIWDALLKIPPNKLPEVDKYFDNLERKKVVEYHK